MEAREGGDEYATYSALHMGPLVRALILSTTIGYAGLIVVGELITISQLSVSVRLSPTLLLLSIAIVVGRTRHPLALSLLTLTAVLMLQIGINLNGFGVVGGLRWVLPGCVLIPVVLATIWSWNWDFYTALIISVFGVLPMLLLGPADDMEIIRYACYMTLAVCLTTLLREFTRRNLLEQLGLQRQLQRQATTDGLTGLLSRNRFFELAQRALEQTQREGEPVCMLYLDADHFKRLNDQHGHVAGDHALIALARCLVGQIREGDLIGRVGGEEFAILVPGIDLQHARARAERLRRAVHGVQRADGTMTVSIGIAAGLHLHAEGVEALLIRADMAMRQAKANGRDQVVAAATVAVP